MSIVETYGITSSTQLIELAKKLKFKLNFVGFTDDLELQPTSDGAYIFNIGDKAGTHWTAGFIKGDTMFYFDSFAVPPEDDLIHILERNSCVRQIIYNSNFQFQNICENLCGIWCVIFLYHMTHSKLATLTPGGRKRDLGTVLIERFDEFKKRYKNLQL